MSDPAAPSPPPRPSLAALGSVRVPRRKRRRWVWVPVLLLLASAAAYLVAQRQPAVTASTVMTAYPSAQYAQLTASGYVVAQRRAAVSSKATGRLIELNVREGSTVEAGALIARVEAADVDAAVRAAEAGVRQAEAARRQAEAVLRQAEVELGNADAELLRARELAARGFFSTQAVDAARRRSDGATASVAAAQAGIAAAVAGQALALAQLQAQQVSRASTEIRAPFDGVVLLKNANVGDLITPFSNAAGTSGAVVTMADMGTLEVEADVSESNVGQVRIDQPVEITLDALPGLRLRGSVARIVPTVDRAKATVMTKVRFEALDPRILPEMAARVQFLSQPASDADLQAVTAVNPKTVVERDGRPVVLRIVAGAVEVVPVTPGRTLGDALELTGDAVRPGDTLVLAPEPGLDGGTQVTVAGP
jgi:RND family efflux transporter MFP subunit